MPGAIPYETFPLFHLGPLPIRTFGMFVALGILVGVWVLTRFAKQRDMDPDALSSLAFWVVGVGIVGARLLFVLTHLSDFAGSPLKVLALWEGGLQFSGSFIVAIAIIWFWLRRHPGVNGRSLMDGLVVALVPGLMIGRLGCVSVGEHLGNETNFFLGWKYLGGETREGPLTVGLTYHNTAIYEILLLAPLAVILFAMARRRLTPGLMAATFFSWYGVQRFSTDLLRTYDRTVMGLTGAQYLAIGMLLGGLYLFWKIRREPGAASATGLTAMIAGALVLLATVF